jgi:uncharacterized protein (TIGR00288 family)
MRSDLSKELKSLLNSDVIKGKVTVQRAYADWRRYPQYIVPLSENSVDLIFAPAYGSSKKNATDIRMAIDGMELVFIRPEIGTYILLTGDSDFSSLVLKLKEYGKYVIGVGIQESTSDILVQNCDEYYSYTSLAGLRKTSEVGASAATDPWVLVEKALEQMDRRRDVMRSDRLKQVMIELDPGFDEGSFGFSKFSKFLAEASSKGLVHLKKLDNGQYEVSSGGRPTATATAAEPKDADRGKSRGRKGGRKEREREDKGAGRQPKEEKAEAAPAEVGGEVADPLNHAYTLLTEAVRKIVGDSGESVRDSDVKRRMLEADSSFDETELGFSKFSRFLRQAHDHEVVDVQKRENGNYEVSLRAPRTRGAPAAESAKPSGRLSPRASRGRRGTQEEPPLFEGQVLSLGRGGKPKAELPEAAAATEGALDLQALGLPSEAGAITRYMSNRYKGVGAKTAEALVDAFGVGVFQVMNDSPERIRDAVPGARGEKVLEAWAEDYSRRSARSASKSSGAVEKADSGKEAQESEESGPSKSTDPVAQSSGASTSKGESDDSEKQTKKPPRRGTRRGRGRNSKE